MDEDGLLWSIVYDDDDDDDDVHVVDDGDNDDDDVNIDNFLATDNDEVDVDDDDVVDDVNDFDINQRESFVYVLFPYLLVTSRAS